MMKTRMKRVRRKKGVDEKKVNLTVVRFLTI